MVMSDGSFLLDSCRATAISVGALSTTGGIFAITGPGGLVRVWNIDAGTHIATWRLRTQPARLEMSADGRQFTAYCVDGYHGTVDHSDGTVPGSVTKTSTREQTGGTWAAQASSASRRIRAVATPGTGLLIAHADRVRSHLHGVASPCTVAVSRFGGLVAAGDSHGYTAVWETTSGRVIHETTWDGERVLALSLHPAISGSYLKTITASTTSGQVAVRRTPLLAAALAETAGLLADLWHRARPSLAHWMRDAIKQAASSRTRQGQYVRELVEARATMVDALTTLDPATRERTRAAIGASARSLYSIQLRAWARWLKELALENPLTIGCSLIALLLAVLTVGDLVTNASTALSGSVNRYALRLATPQHQLEAVAIFLTVAGLLVLLGRGWRAVRGARNIARLLAIATMTRTVGIAVVIPPQVDVALNRYAHLRPPPPWRQPLPYPVWLGLIGALYVTALGTGARWVLRRLRQSRAHQLAVGDALIPALVAVAYSLRRAADDPQLAGDSELRTKVIDQIHLAGRLAEREWVYAHRTGHRIADDATRFQGYAIAHAIRRRTRQVALGGPSLARAADAFAIAVANAALGDWEALGDDPANLPPIRRNRTTRILTNISAIILPLLAALLVLRFSFGHPAAANTTAGILVSIAAAHAVSLLRLNEDFDTGSKIAAVFRNDHT
jgi:hypothetical protein